MFLLDMSGLGYGHYFAGLGTSVVHAGVLYRFNPCQANTLHSTCSDVAVLYLMKSSWNLSYDAEIWKHEQNSQDKDLEHFL